MVLISTNNVFLFFFFVFSQAPPSKTNKSEIGGETLLFVSNELNQTDCLAPSWFPLGGLIGNVVSLSSN